MRQELFRLSVRFDLNNPEHAEIVSILKDLNKSMYSTMSGFVIEAIRYYIRALSDDTITNSGKKRLEERSADFVTNGDLEKRLIAYSKDLRLFVYETLQGYNPGRTPPGTLSGDNGGGYSDGNYRDRSEGQIVAPPGGSDIDITMDEQVMRDLESWAT